MGNANGRQSGTSSPQKQSSNSTSASQHIRTFDGGSLSPHGIYPGQPDYNPTHVLKYIRERRLAPFYKGLDDYEDDWTDYQLSYFVKEGKLPPTIDPPSPVSVQSAPANRPPSNSSTPSLVLPPSVDEVGNLRPGSPRIRGMSVVETGQQGVGTPDSQASSMNSPGGLAVPKDKRTRPRAQTTGSSYLIPTKGKPLEVVIYRGAIECPVCFLFYPPNINRTRCCWKPICTECFVEMKRAEPHYPTNDDENPTPTPQNLNLNPMNLISDPVRCPFCVKPEFGVVYNLPIWLPQERRLDIPPREIATSPLHSSHDLPMDKREEMYPPGHERVVLSDNIRPDWYQALAHRRRVEARRLATATALQQALAVAGQRRRGSNVRTATPYGATAGVQSAMNEQRRIGRRVDGIVRITRDEADEMMLQEAIRQSLQTQEEERSKREEEERKKNGSSRGTDTGSEPVTPTTSSASSPAPRLSTSSPITAPVLPRLQQSTSTSPPSPRSFFAAFRARSGSGSSRTGSSPPKNPLVQARPSSTTNLYPPMNTVRRQPSLPEALLSSSTSASLATAMHESIIPGQDDSRPSISSPLASQAVRVPSVEVQTPAGTGESSTPPNTSVSTSSTLDDEILPVETVAVARDSGLKTRGEQGSVEEREIVELH